MDRIRKVPIEDAKKLVIGNVQWGYEDYHAPVYAQLAYDDEGFLVRFTVGEKNPLREKKKHLDAVHEDSCVEFFVNFTPESSGKYINFEVNAAGVMDAAIRTGRHDAVPLEIAEIEGLNITPEIREADWSVSYRIGFGLIRKYFPDFSMEKCSYIIGNLYKCGDKTETEHYLSYFKVGTETPDFHRPEYFGKFEIER